MGRWGDELYESDGTLDYFHISITKPIERELAFWLSPEQVTHDGRWLAQVLTVIELILLLKRNNNGGDPFMENPKAVRRWREVFFSVWDGEWQTEPDNYRYYAYDTPDYRKQHRAAVMERFDDLERITEYWADDLEDINRPEFPPLPQDYPLPFYSLNYWTNSNHETFARVEEFIGELIDELIREVDYLFFAKRRERVWTYIEHVWVAVDLLSVFGEAYKQETITEEKVRIWREINIEAWKQRMGKLPSETEPKPLYNNVLGLFDRLEALAKKYPTHEW